MVATTKYLTKGLEGVLYSDIKCIMGNGHIHLTCGQNDRETRLKTLSSRNFVAGR